MSDLRHIIEAQQFDRDGMADIFRVAREMEQVVQHYGSNILNRRVMASLFYEPSTRTRLSFESAMRRLGGDVITTESAQEFSSAAKGETLEDTLVGILSAEIVEAYVEGGTVNITMKFVSEQINATRDENGDVIDGNPNAVIDVTDFWTFARDTKSSDPNWALVATSNLE